MCAMLAVAQQFEHEENNTPASANPLQGNLPYRVRGAVQPAPIDVDFYVTKIQRGGRVKVERLPFVGSGPIFVNIGNPSGYYETRQLDPGASSDFYVEPRTGGAEYVWISSAWNQTSAYDLFIYQYYDAILEGIGNSQQEPVLPSRSPFRFLFQFDSVRRGVFLDPPTENGIEYGIAPGAHFKGVIAFPTGFMLPFHVTAGNRDYGFFYGGSSLQFDEPGETSFRITNIASANLLGPASFPIKLDFDQEYVPMTMRILQPTSIGRR